MRSKDRFGAHRGHQSHRHTSRQDVEHHRRKHRGAKDRTGSALPKKNVSFTGRRKTRSISQERSNRRTSSQMGGSGDKRGKVDYRLRNNNDHRESAQTAEASGAGAIPIANYSSSDSETPRSKSSVAPKSSVAEIKVTDSKKVAPGRQSHTETAAANGDKSTVASKTKTDDKPKETLEDMELFLKQLKANKQQQMLKK